MAAYPFVPPRPDHGGADLARLPHAERLRACARAGVIVTVGALLALALPAGVAAAQTPNAACLVAPAVQAGPQPQAKHAPADSTQRIGTSAAARPASSMLPTLVADIWPGAPSADVTDIVAVSHRIFFVANDGVHGSELWTSRGTAATTHLVRDIWLGSGSSSPANSTSAGGTLFFTADDGLKGNELWKSDGTAGGTIRVSDTVPGPTSAWVNHIVAVGNQVYFDVSDYVTAAPLEIHAIWKSDGTRAGTSVVRSWTSMYDDPPAEITAVGSRVFFAFRGRLWETDGTTAGTTRVKPHDAFFGPTNLVAVGKKLFFDAVPPGGGCVSPDPELWVTDGSKASLKDLGRAAWGGVSFNGRFYYAAPYGELWKSDGTPKGTVVVRDTANDPSDMTVVGGRIYFTTNNGNEEDNATSAVLWTSDGTTAGTLKLKTFKDTSGAYLGIDALVNVNGELMFYAVEPVDGAELWKSDGTKVSTVVCTDMDPSGPLWPGQLTSLRGRVFFTATDQAVGEELWTYAP